MMQKQRRPCCGGGGGGDHPSLIPGLPDDVSTQVLLRVPRALHGTLRLVCRSWNVSLQSATFSSLRSALHISEDWVFFLLRDHTTLLLYDPLLHRLSLPFSPPTPSFSPPPPPDFGLKHILAASGSRIFFLEAIDCDASLVSVCCFDAARMQWLDNCCTIPMGVSRLNGFVSASMDGHLYLAGGWSYDDDTMLGWKESTGVERFDLTTKVWETVPSMHEPRITAKAVVLQGRLCVIGGGKHSGEIWDAKTQEWILEPALLPPQFFQHGTPLMATVMGTLYALPRNCDKILCYDSTTKLWTSLGDIPLMDYPCPCCDPAKTKSLCQQLLGVRQELWIVLKCNDGYCDNRIISCVPTSGSMHLSWRILPITLKLLAVTTVHV